MTSKGERNSSGRVRQRCLALLRRLLLSDATDQDLMKVIAEFEDHASTVNEKQLRNNLAKDLNRLREEFQCSIEYVQNEAVYRLTALEQPLIDLPDDALRGFAFLQKTFSNADIVHREEVLRFLDLIQMMIPHERKKQVAQERGLLNVELKSRDSKPVDAEILEKISYACSAQQEIEFLYRSPKQQDGLPRRHRVEPYRYRFEPLRRHYILEAFRLEVLEPYHFLPNDFGTFRLERMFELKILPKRFVPRQLKPLGKEIVYRLAPEIARLRDVTEYIPDSKIVYCEDGSAEVHAVSYNLFMDLRTLLHYGYNCEVIAGDEAKRIMRDLVESMARVYNLIP